MNNISSDNVVLELPAKSEFVSTVRLTASSVASRAGFNVDEIEDIKVSISEICNLILTKQGDVNRYRIDFEIIEQQLIITFTGVNTPLTCAESCLKEEYGLYIITALMDTVELCKEDNSIVISKKIGD
jgi:serine/threonine-protein kinase RsbW